MTRPLIVVHTSAVFANPFLQGEHRGLLYRTLFSEITREVKTRLQSDGLVYYLHTDRGAKAEVYEELQRYLPRMKRFALTKDIELQNLLVKQSLVRLGIGNIDICGVTYPCCVRELSLFLDGKPGNETLVESYDRAARELLLPTGYAQRLKARRIHPQILEHLTDRDWCAQTRAEETSTVRAI